jgi:hypothetical protein
VADRAAVGADPPRLRRDVAAWFGWLASWALSHGEVEQLLTRQDISLRERTLWRMLYETAARWPRCWRLTSRTWTC